MQAATVNDGARRGRGYSLEELREAGIDARTARKNGVPTDVWRKTKYPENVEQLKSAIKSIKESPKEKPAAKKEEKTEGKPKAAKKAGKKKKEKNNKTRKKGKK